jgi:integral membrane sensor domain MASE1/two-component sensor histidine kinase/CheY-like chemotaxis protein
VSQLPNAAGARGSAASHPPWRPPRTLRLLGFAAAYLLAAGFARLLALAPDTGISIWPPSGLFVATLLLSRPGHWPWWIGAALPAELAANLLWFGNALPVAALIFAGNALEAVAGAFLVGRACGRPLRLDSLREVLALVFLGAGLAPVASATVGAATLAWFGLQSFASAWPLFWIGDATGVLVFAPVCLVLFESWRDMAKLSMARLGEALILALIFLGVAVLSLSGALPFAYIIMPALLWAAVRFEIKGAAVALLLLAVLTALFTVAGTSQFAGDPPTQPHRQVMLQLFLAVSALAALVVAALARQNHQAVAFLKAANLDLEARVDERTARLRQSERRFGVVLEALPIGVALSDRSGKTLVANPVYARYVGDQVPSADRERAPLWEGYHPDGRRIEPQDFPAARALRGERVWPGIELLFHGDPERGPVWTRVAALPSRDETGAVVSCAVVIDDIDQEKRAVDALRESETRMRLVQEAAGVGTWEWDIVRGEIRWSEQNFRLHGRDPALGPPAYDDWRLALHPEDRDRANAAVLGAVARREDFDTEYRVTLPDGTVRWLVGRGRLLCDASGRPERMMGINLDITARKEAEERQALLAREVDHRAKNALAVVQSLVRLTRADRPAEFAKALEGRIAALARAHTLLAAERWTGGGLRPLLEEELAAYQPTGQVVLQGPPVTLKVDAVQPLSLCLHELATNAAKYGALSIPGGRVEVAWEVEGSALGLTWRETGGPRILAPPARAGFGSRLLDAAARGQLGGDVALDLRPGGLVCRLRIAGDRLQEVGGGARAAAVAALPAAPSAAGVPSGLRALVAEDEPLLAMDLARELQALGVVVAATADSIPALQRQIENAADRLDLAVLDVNLSGHASFPSADALLAQGVPVLFVTGYGDLPGGRWTGDRRVGLLRKPVTRAELAQAIATLLRDETGAVAARAVAHRPVA